MGQNLWFKLLKFDNLLFFLRQNKQPEQLTVASEIVNARLINNENISCRPMKGSPNQ